MTPKHTPGPWRVTLAYSNAHNCLDVWGNGLLIAECRHYKVDPGMSAANANLIAAAPDMLAALQLINVDKDGDGFVCREAMDRIRAVIAQATGEATP